jgi:hypothetical protein
VKIIDDFIPYAQAVRDDGLCAEYVDWPGPDGEVYKRVAVCEVPGLRAALERVMGPVEMLGMAYRLNFAGEVPNAAVHSDIGWGTHALVLYLSEGEGGTAFWRHKATGAERLAFGDVDLLEQVQGDWNNESSWEMVGLAEIRLGRAVIFESELFHSRYPFGAFGSGANDGRLIAVAFFNLEQA